jgi:hypothetical protein
MSNRAAKGLRVIGFLAAGALALYFLAGFHGDGWVKPTIRVQVEDPHGSPIEEATVVFFERESLRDIWLSRRVESRSTEDIVPEPSTGASNGYGQAEVQGSFGAAFYLFHTFLGGRGVLRVDKLGYVPCEVIIDSRERRREILNELVELSVTLQHANSSQPHGL